jgi:nitrogen fixation NifU-like protein
MVQNRISDLYRNDAILDHCMNPRNNKLLNDVDFNGDAINPFCGDEIHFSIKLTSIGRISKIGFIGDGCAINQASGSMFSVLVKGFTFNEINECTKLFRQHMQNSEENIMDVGDHDISALFQVRKFPIRIKCVLLACSALENAYQNYIDSI